MLKDVKDIELFARGKRGVISVGTLKGKRVSIKTKRPDSEAEGRIENEACYLKLLNRHGIGPKLLMFGEGSLVYEFVEGEFILDYLDHANIEKARKVILDVFDQMYILDSLGINKEEMHHPLKHILVNDDKPVLLDFERCHPSKKPKNVTQFVQFITRDKIIVGLGLRKPKDLLDLLNAYKKKYDEPSFQAIRNGLGLER